MITANKYEDMCAKLDKQIHAKMNPAVANQNPTPRRMRMVEGMRKDGEQLMRVRSILELHAILLNRYGKLPSLLEALKITSIASATRLESSNDMEKIQMILNISNQISYTFGATPESTKEAKLREKINSLMGAKIPGFFTTPPELAKKVVESAIIQEGMTVLEPSAGMGALADAVRDAGGKPYCVEVNQKLCDILEMKGHMIIGHDFEVCALGTYDRIVMNPPFENLQDIDHVYKAWRHLKENGKLVAIMSPSPWYRTCAKATGFRNWLETVAHVERDLPEKSFAGTITPTNVNTKLLEIWK